MVTPGEVYRHTSGKILTVIPKDSVLPPEFKRKEGKAVLAKGQDGYIHGWPSVNRFLSEVQLISGIDSGNRSSFGDAEGIISIDPPQGKAPGYAAVRIINNPETGSSWTPRQAREWGLNLTKHIWDTMPKGAKGIYADFDSSILGLPEAPKRFGGRKNDKGLHITFSQPKSPFYNESPEELADAYQIALTNGILNAPFEVKFDKNHLDILPANFDPVSEETNALAYVALGVSQSTRDAINEIRKSLNLGPLKESTQLHISTASIAPNFLHRNFIGLHGWPRLKSDTNAMVAMLHSANSRHFRPRSRSRSRQTRRRSRRSRRRSRSLRRRRRSRR